MPSQSWLDARKQVKVYMTIAEYQALKAYCLQHGVSISDTMRERLAPILDTGS